MALELQKALSDEVAKFQNMEKEKQKEIGLVKQLDVQLNENSSVKEELDILEPEARVFKLVGPALLKQELKDAKDNVNNRIKYISEEKSRHEKAIQDLDKKQEEQKEVVQKLQQKLQSMQQAAVAAKS